jgi:hypothetical protein
MTGVVSSMLEVSGILLGSESSQPLWSITPYWTKRISKDEDCQSNPRRNMSNNANTVWTKTTERRYLRFQGESSAESS